MKIFIEISFAVCYDTHIRYIAMIGKIAHLRRYREGAFVESASGGCVWFARELRLIPGGWRRYTPASALYANLGGTAETLRPIADEELFFLQRNECYVEKHT